jgi:uncharacterized FAD-dependent dehydrogenase
VLGVDARQVQSVRIVRRALDARKKQDVHFLLSVTAELEDEAAKRLLAKNDVRVEPVAERPETRLTTGAEAPRGRIVVVGLGPAGLFAAHLLAQYGYAPLVLERGDVVEARAERVERYWATGELGRTLHVMFGEGGAGTFSDGKLTRAARTRAGMPCLTHWCALARRRRLRSRKAAYRHDRLRGVVSAMRREIERLGGEVRFRALLSGIKAHGGRVYERSVTTPSGEETIDCGALLLAVGQGARDTYQMLLDAGVAMAPRRFAVGVRAEHPQELIDRAQLGALAGHRGSARRSIAERAVRRAGRIFPFACARADG